MGTWLATVRFPDGLERYAEYSTVVESTYNPLYPEVCRVGGTLPSGDECHRDKAVGEPLPYDRNVPLSSAEAMVLVTVTRQPDDDRWHALYCPSRAVLVGPLSDFYRHALQEDYDLIRDDDGVRHLCGRAVPPAICGAEPTGERLGLYFPSPGMHWSEEVDGPYPESPPAPDLFAEWDAPDICRPCLLAWLLMPEPITTPDPPPAPPSTWWTRVKRAWLG
ncbi:hypothetical protein Q0Z83_090470 [Actinoplanes sichuanensis]|uniref:Uncharacterized protein n=1 Tax=Actinoplanes sichuanensis TaxID=512349 RepID=A0ABW4AKR1_9ACTN|nr:hypothetical protein [Actinoplanes sichuanensis]BEL10856.1 hypothetical protein Q0Z83_090470 [Actinoplanes sichuanensis]